MSDTSPIDLDRRAADLFLKLRDRDFAEPGTSPVSVAPTPTVSTKPVRRPRPIVEYLTYRNAAIELSQKPANVLQSLIGDAMLTMELAPGKGISDATNMDEVSKTLRLLAERSISVSPGLVCKQELVGINILAVPSAVTMIWEELLYEESIHGRE
jgi:hypothetical protein